MTKYQHGFIEKHEGLPCYGWNRISNENTVVCYLQMFSDDTLLKTLTKRLSDAELDEIYAMINRLLKIHLNDAEYHQLFLKEQLSSCAQNRCVAEGKKNE